MILNTIALAPDYDLLVFSDRVVAVRHLGIIRRVSVGIDTFAESQRIHAKLLIDHVGLTKRETRQDSSLVPDWRFEATVTGRFTLNWVENWVVPYCEPSLRGEADFTPRERLMIALES